MVREFGAHAVQGFYFSRGVHASECLAAAQRCSERLVRVTAASLATPCLPPRRRLGRVSAAATR
jgi:EAL domain-containing protein (putative c-di-GMP-specific phosphodiesterase class I)